MWGLGPGAWDRAWARIQTELAPRIRKRERKQPPKFPWEDLSSNPILYQPGSIANPDLLSQPEASTRDRTQS